MSNTTTTTTSSPSITFANDADTGFWSSSDDQITIVAGGSAANKQIDNYKKVHVARRRQAKKLSRPEVWRFEGMVPTTLDVSQNS